VRFAFAPPPPTARLMSTMVLMRHATISNNKKLDFTAPQLAKESHATRNYAAKHHNAMRAKLHTNTTNTTIAQRRKQYDQKVCFIDRFFVSNAGVFELLLLFDTAAADERFSAPFCFLSISVAHLVFLFFLFFIIVVLVPTPYDTLFNAIVM
jgi:hypothetical protein